MSIDVLIGILIPFVGTALGAACVFFLKDQIPALVQKGLLGFASGVILFLSKECSCLLSSAIVLLFLIRHSTQK